MKAKNLTLGKLARFFGVMFVAFGREIRSEAASVIRAREMSARLEALARPMWYS